MDLHDKLLLTSAIPASLDGAEKILLAELQDAASAPTRIAVVDATSSLIFDELAHLFPHANLVAYNDSFVAAREIDAFAHEAQWVDRFSRVTSSTTARFPQALFAGCTAVLMRLPKSLDYLSEFVHAAASFMDPQALLLCAERTKYMTPSQNDVLGKVFGDVTASLGRFKSRALRARRPIGELVPCDFPKQAHLSELGLEVVAHGGVFAGTRLDIGSRLLVENLDELLADFPQATDFVDAGCGSGVLSARIAQLRSVAHIVGVDVSAAAVLSTVKTAAANGFTDRITAVQDDALAVLPANSAHVVVCNPPFHTGTALDTDVAGRMFRNAGRILRPGGELWTVYNSPLPYKATLNKLVGRTVVVASNRKFTVTVSTKD